MRRLRNNDEVIQICELYQTGLTTRQVAEKVGRSQAYVAKLVLLNGLSRTHSESNGMQRPNPSIIDRTRTRTRAHAVNESYFDVIDTEPKAYWLGFLLADGYISQENRVLGILLAPKDTDHIERFRQAIGSTHPVTTGTAGGYERSMIQIGSVALVKSLAAHGVIARKTGTAKWPTTVPFGLLRHFLRGYSDGNGSFTTTMYKGRKVPKLTWALYAHEAILISAQNFLVSVFGLPRTKLSKNRSSKDSFGLFYSGAENAHKIYHLLYDGATSWLPRKRDIIEKWMREYGSPK